MIVNYYPSDLLIPFISATLDGNLLFEWEAEGSPIANIDLKKMEIRFHVFIANDEDSSKAFNPSDERGFKNFVDFLSECHQLVSRGSTESFRETPSPYGIALERFADKSPTHPIEELMREYGLEV